MKILVKIGCPVKALFLSLILISLWQPMAHAAGGSVCAWAWSADVGGVTNVPPGLTNVVAVAGGLDHALALRADGTVATWAGNSYSLTNVPIAATNVTAISAGWGFSMALREDGTVVTWGDPFVEPPQGLSNVVAIAAGGHQFCLALRADKTVVAWGWNGYGQTNVPIGLTNVISIAGGLDHSAALCGNGTVAIWGSTNFDELNVPAGLTNVVAIAAGWSQTLALREDGTVVGWGADGWIPAGTSNIVAVAADWDTGKAFLRRDGTVVFSPPGISNVITIACGHFFGLAIKANQPLEQVLTVSATHPALTAGKFLVSVSTQRGKVYALEYKDTLAESGWTPLPLAAGNGEVRLIHDSDASALQRFYRVLEW